MQNLALGKPASQSSTGHKGAASRAVDGDTNPDFWKGSCSHTSDAEQQWWSVDLQKVSTVVKVYVLAFIIKLSSRCFKERHAPVGPKAEETWGKKRGLENQMNAYTKFVAKGGFETCESLLLSFETSMTINYF